MGLFATLCMALVLSGLTYPVKDALHNLNLLESQIKRDNYQDQSIGDLQRFIAYKFEFKNWRRVGCPR